MEGVVKPEFKNRVYSFSVEVIRFVNEVTSGKRIFYPLVDQLIRASTSIRANVTEAESSSLKKRIYQVF